LSDPEAIKETAKAVQEVAITTGKAIEATQGFGRFVERFIGGTLEQTMGRLEDNAKFKRWENRLKLQQKAEALLKDYSLPEPSRPLPLKLALPYLEASSLEEDDTLQNLWAALLVNGTSAESGVDLQRPYINVLENISPLDAKILQAIYSSPHPDVERNGFWTAGLPDEVIPVPPENAESRKDQLSDALKYSLVSLERLDCLKLGEAFYGGQLFDRFYRTAFGQFFYNACTIKRRT
jgi:hypothetical protein